MVLLEPDEDRGGPGGHIRSMLVFTARHRAALRGPSTRHGSVRGSSRRSRFADWAHGFPGRDRICDLYVREPRRGGLRCRGAVRPASSSHGPLHAVVGSDELRDQIGAAREVPGPGRSRGARRRDQGGALSVGAGSQRRGGFPQSRSRPRSAFPRADVRRPAIAGAWLLVRLGRAAERHATSESRRAARRRRQRPRARAAPAVRFGQRRLAMAAAEPDLARR